MTTGHVEAAPVDEAVVRDLVARVLAGFNAHDADRFVSVMTEDVVFEHSAGPRTHAWPRRGKRLLRQHHLEGVPGSDTRTHGRTVLPSPRSSSQLQLARGRHADRAARPSWPGAAPGSRGERAIVLMQRVQAKLSRHR
ncbi:MAG: nuclear transport factor 2 family protein [Mycobacterium sp.]